MPEPLSAAELARLRDLDAKASKGWRVWWFGNTEEDAHENGTHIEDEHEQEVGGETFSLEEAQFIVAMRNALPRLLAEHERLTRDVVEASGMLMVEIPEPGTDMAKVMRANAQMRRERDDARRERDEARAALREAIFEHGAHCVGRCPDRWRKALGDPA